MRKPIDIGQISSGNVSSRVVRQITDDEFRDLCRRIRRRICGKESTAPRQVRSKNFSHYKRVIRRLQLIRHPPGERRAYRKIRSRSRKSSVVLDALYPRRSRAWKNPTERTPKHEEHRVALKDFSFIDNPLGTLEMLRHIAKAEAKELSFKMDFLDSICLDVGPYLVLGVIRQRMLPNCSGGTISGGLGKVLTAVGLDRFLGMNFHGKRGWDVLPFPLKYGARESTSAEHVGVTTKQRTVDQFIVTLDEWLWAVNLRLSDDGRGHVGRIIGEAIDNAERHSDGAEGAGRWWITGFMTMRVNEGGEVGHHCHVGLLSLGSSIANSIAQAPERIRDKIGRYTKLHNSKTVSTETLATIYALQDGITRDPPGGIGMMDLFSMVSVLGSSQSGARAAVAILSGRVCVIAKEPFIRPNDHPERGRELWFNEANTLENPPDNDYVIPLHFDFPGTLVTLRFQIDPDQLAKK